MIKAPFRFAAMLGVAAAALAQSSPDELIQLIRGNDLTALKARLDSKTANTGDSRDTTLLMYAAGYGSTDAVKVLISAGASINAKNQFDTTALIYAASSYEKARLLIEKGADVNAKTKSGRTALMVAAACDGCGPIVKLLLAKGADPKIQTDRGMTALMAAADTGDFEGLSALVAAGADVKVADGGGDDALQFAAAGCSVEGVKLLLAKGANPNTANTFGGEVKFGKIQLTGLTALMFAAPSCSPSLIKALLDAGAKVNLADGRGMTPLMLAVSGDYYDPATVRMLLKAGADVNAKSAVGETALDWARKSGNKALISVLQEAGAKEGLAYAAPARKTANPLTTLASLEKGTAVVQHSAAEFFQQSGCVGCHHQPAALSAVTVARKAGAKTDEVQAGSYIKMMEGMSKQFLQTLVERTNSGGSYDRFMLMLATLADDGYKPNPMTDSVATYLASYQHRDGSWWFGGAPRAPMEDGRIGRTALAIRALQAFSTPALKTEFEGRVLHAKDFLVKTKIRTNDDAAMQVAGLYWAGGSGEKVRALGHTLVSAQHSDGGWSQNPDIGSDAYATGQTLWALQLAGVLKAEDPAYEKGVQYLLNTQWEDGSWYVRSRAPKFQPYFQSGFPFDHDQWISAAATSWAVRGLAPAVRKN